MTDIDLCYADLAEAVVVLALEDYQWGRENIDHPVKGDLAKYYIEDCESFFLGDSFRELYEMDGKKFLEQWNENPQDPRAMAKRSHRAVECGLDPEADNLMNTED